MLIRQSTGDSPYRVRSLQRNKLVAIFMRDKQIKQFTENASPDNWLKYANELKQSALRLWEYRDDLILEFNIGSTRNIERPVISRSYMLLAGLSIENVLKAYIVAIAPSLINKGILDRKLQIHDLNKLSTHCNGVSFDENDIELMRVLSEAIPYWGRYPIPINFQQIKTEKIVDSNINSNYISLFDKLFSSTLNKIRGGWDAGNGVGFSSFGYQNFETD